MNATAGCSEGRVRGKREDIFLPKEKTNSRLRHIAPWHKQSLLARSTVANQSSYGVWKQTLHPSHDIHPCADNRFPPVPGLACNHGRRVSYEQALFLPRLLRGECRQPHGLHWSPSAVWTQEILGWSEVLHKSDLRSLHGLQQILRWDSSILELIKQKRSSWRLPGSTDQRQLRNEVFKSALSYRGPCTVALICKTAFTKHWLQKQQVPHPPLHIPSLAV